MKRLLSIFLVLFTITSFTACSKDNEEDSDELIGRWQLISVRTTSEGQTADEPIDTAHPSYLSFSNDGTCSFEGYATEINSDREVVKTPETNKGKYSISNDDKQLTIIKDKGDEREVYTINKLTQNMLELYMNDDDLLVSMTFKRIK